VVEAKAQRRVDVSGSPHFVADGEACLVDELRDDPSEHQPRRVAEDALDVLAEVREVPAGDAQHSRCGGRRDLDQGRPVAIWHRDPMD
jgi:aminoglycoside phosphotransferase (APT) family kinase protein